MANERPLLARLLNTPDLARTVPQLQPDVLHRVIEACGLEDCGELLALATPEQLARVLDVDVWRAGRPGADESLDVERFGVWLDTLMQAGAETAAEKLAGLDIALVTAGLARHVSVFDLAAVSPGRASRGTQSCKIGGYLIEARRATTWDTIVELLLFLDVERAGYFHRLMAGCRHLSNGSREADGFHNLMADDRQKMFDLACEREARREKQGYVTPAQARAFLQMARQLPLQDERPPSANPVAVAYFRAIEPMPPAETGERQESSGALPATHVLVEILREAGVLTAQPRALLDAPEGHASRLALMHAYMESSAAGADELAYLANTIMAGCSIQARAFTAQDASDAAVAICNLGLENWPHRWIDRDLVTAFQVGWTVLHRDVCMYTAEQLIGVLTDIHCGDRDIQMQLHELRIELTRSCRDGSPWRARRALDAIVMLDAPSWAALAGLIGECPVMHAAISASRGSGVRAVDITAFEFISENRQIASIREFMRALPAALTR